MPTEPGSLGTVLFTVGVLFPLAAVLVCAVIGLVKR